MSFDAVNQASDRQTLHEARKIAPAMDSGADNGRTILEFRDLTTNMDSPLVPDSPGSRLKRPTLHEARNISLDGNTTPTNPARDSDESGSMDMSFQMSNEPQQRQTVICKSPAKPSSASRKLTLFERGNRTLVSDNEIDVTQGIDATMHVSYHPLHLTMCEKEHENRRDHNHDMEMSGMAILDDAKCATHQLASSVLRSSGPVQVNFNLPDAATVAEISLSSTDASIGASAAEKINLNKTPYYAPGDEDLDPSIVMISDESVDAEKSHAVQKSRATTIDDLVYGGPSTSYASDRRRTYIGPSAQHDEPAVDYRSPRLDRLAEKQLKELQRITEKCQSMFMNNVTTCSDDYENVKLDSVHYLTLDHTQLDLPSSETTRRDFEKTVDGVEQLKFLDDEHCDLVNTMDSTMDDTAASAGHPLDAPSTLAPCSGTHKAVPDPILRMEQDLAFKRSNLLRRSTASHAHRATDSGTAKSDSTSTEASAMPAHRQPLEESVASTSGTAADLNETSYLRAVDQSVSDLVIDFSGYDRLVGLSTPDDVVRNFVRRASRVLGRMGRDEDDESPDSQNVPAPSWTFLWDNKCKWEE